MVHTVQTSFFTKSRLHDNRFYPGMLYTAIVNTEDGEQRRHRGQRLPIEMREIL